MKQISLNTFTHIPALLHHKKTHQYGLTTLFWGMIAACCWLLAYWTWIFVTPSATLAPLTRDPLAFTPLSIEPITNAHLFGVSESPVSSVVATQTLSALGYKLHGVFAGEGKKGVAAIFNIGQKDLAFTLGSEITAGAVLEHVYADHVEIKYHGVLERLDLVRATPATGQVLITPPIAPIVAPPQANSPPAPEALNALVGQQGQRLLGMRP
ncbi:MAG: type II secretion system protein N [Gallionella sp.]|nr:type II secretion system protein N [Gallionella sp.]